MFKHKKNKTNILPEGFPSFDAEAMQSEVQRRMALPQRHRLLQGFPMRSLMSSPGEDWQEELEITNFRRWPNQAIVCVMPHPFCVPALKGCGFCTFPHEGYKKETMMPLAKTIAFDLATHAAKRDISVPSLYFGGGTANLVSDEALELICTAVLARFGFIEEEVSLEGVPRFFTDAHFEQLKTLGAKRTRISMGVQTFDEAWLAKMGRLKIGAPEHVQDAVALAKKHGAHTSLDLLINMPGQTLDAMHQDLEHAMALDVEQICIYHLVLFEGLDTEWSKDPKMLDALPNNDESFSNWLSLRKRLLEGGYAQSTLTNFEKKSIPLQERFHYEKYSFANSHGAGLGFGPGAITHSGHRKEQTIKYTNHTTAAGYLASKKERYIKPEFAYVYREHEKRLNVLTRSLAALSMMPSDDDKIIFANELDLLTKTALLIEHEHNYKPTPKGMFYADTIAGVLSHRSILYSRGKPETLLEAQAVHMG